jgi:tetratricopeptide (TPR) repeat protein
MMLFKLLLLLISVPVYVTIKPEAKQFYDNAFSFLQKEEPNQALASFRTAVRLDNSSYLYWNDLGVTEMRVGQLQKAYKRFRRSLELEPSFAVAKKNLDEIITYLFSEKSQLSEIKVKEIVSAPLHRKLYSENQNMKLNPFQLIQKKNFNKFF